MKATVEISLYPLHQEYEASVLNFLAQLKNHEGITIETNGLSTQIFGDYHQIMALLTEEMLEVLTNQNAIFLLKIGKGILRFSQ